MTVTEPDFQSAPCLAEGEVAAAGRALGLPARRIFYLLDHVMVPINMCLTPEEVQRALEDAGATDGRRRTRRADFGCAEQLHRGLPYAAETCGVGENQYVFSIT